MAGTRLKRITSSRLSWSKWTELHPESSVLSQQTGYDRDYGTDPYAGYARIGSTWFPVGDVRRDLEAKDRVLGITVKQQSKAYPLEVIVQEEGTLSDRVGDTRVRIRIEDGQVVSVKDGQGQAMRHLFAYWFAWQAFHPETQVFSRP
jgi:hypothetical protein